jgi:B12-binding domain/radical SAM domain protein
VEDLRVVVRYRKTNAYGHHAVLGALTQEDPPGRWSVRFARSEAEAIAEIDTAQREAHRVLVTWSFYSPDVHAVTAELVRVRAATDDPAVTHLAGGVHASAEPERTLHAGFDLVAVGEGEATFVALVAALAAGGPVADVAGLAYLDPAGTYVTTGPAERHELDRYPPFAPRYHCYNPIEITRGCIYACRFCQTPYLFKARFRHRSIPNVREHVRHMKAEGMRYVRFITPSALSYGTQTEEPDLAAVEELLATAREAMGPDGKVYFGSFPSEIRPEHLTPEALALLRRYVDNDHLIVGAQSGSDSVLAAAKRGHGVEEVERAVRHAVAAGFRCDVDVLFGLPGESDADARATVALAERLSDLGARIHSHTFLPLPGTPFRNAPPGRVPPPVRLDLERLAARGRLYGQWARQEEVAVRLTEVVRRPRPTAPPGT